MNLSVKNTNLNYRLFKDKLFYYLIIAISVITIVPVLLILSKLFIKGYRQINLSFFTEVAPNTLEAMTAVANNEIISGGILNGITGSIFMVLIASIIAVPIGILTGIYLSENQDKIYTNLIRTLTDILQGVPSIVLGIIGYIWIVKAVTNGFSALAGGVSLSIMMLPLIIRSTEETLKMIPESIKEAGLALGVPYHKVIFKLLLPTGLSGLLTGVLLSVSRILGETAPLLLTALGSYAINWNIETTNLAFSPNLIAITSSITSQLLLSIYVFIFGNRKDKEKRPIK